MLRNLTTQFSQQNFFLLQFLVTQQIETKLESLLQKPRTICGPLLWQENKSQ